MAEQGNTDGILDLQGFFATFGSFQNQFGKLISACRDLDPTVTVLALQGLYAIENNVNSYQFQHHVDESDWLYVRQILREWRNNLPFVYDGYLHSFIQQRSIPTLRSLTIFKEFDVPLFIDNYGKKELLRNYTSTQVINIDRDYTPIYHVTHQPEANKICEERCIKPSDNKNMVAGTWFGIDLGTSIYGSIAFKTTLGKLGVQDLRQGEIVSYKKEVNVILYAGSRELVDAHPKAWNLKVPVVDVSKCVKISIFVPSEFLPNCDTFCTVFDQPFKVDHSGFCVKELRSFGAYKCPDHLPVVFGNMTI